jgi:tetratricopeptide (TPR) repeat protein
VARAVAEFGAGRWAEARALFLRAHELWPSARTYRTLGMTSFELRAYARALAELQAALDDPRRPLEPAQRQEVLQLVERTRPFVGRYRVRLSPADASLLVDGAPQVLDGEGVLVLEVGSHELLARAAGHAELRRRLDVQGREDQELTLELIAQAPQAPAAATAPAPARDQPETDEDGGGRLWTWIAGGTAIVLAGTATGLWLASDAEYDEEFAKCNDDGVPTCGDDEVDGTWEDLETASYVSAGFAIGAGVAAVTLFFLEGADEEAPIAVPGPGGVQVRARF